MRRALSLLLVLLPTGPAAHAQQIVCQPGLANPSQTFCGPASRASGKRIAIVAGAIAGGVAVWAAVKHHRAKKPKAVQTSYQGQGKKP